MNISEILRQYAAEENNSNLSNQKDINLARASLSVEKPDREKLGGENLGGATTPEPALILAPIIFLVMAGVVVCHKLKLLQKVHKVGSLYQIPCKNCRYFSKNYYLKCAVHPSTVLTKEAINCCDYHPQDKKTVKFPWFSEHKQN